MAIFVYAVKRAFFGIYGKSNKKILIIRGLKTRKPMFGMAVFSDIVQVIELTQL